MASDSENERGRRRHKKDKKRKKSKKERRRRSSSSASSTSSTELLRKLEEEREELKAKRKREKERLKATETLEEKRNRRILKKELKAAKRMQSSGAWEEEEASRYTNDDNPFGDSNLTQTFRWTKKLRQEGLDKLDERQLQRMQRKKQEEQRKELEEVRLRRLNREREREERQAMIELEERTRENDKFARWRQQEDEFHLQQARLRSRIRIQDGRAKPIDLLAKYASADQDEGEVDAVEMHEPYTYLNGLTVADLEDLLADIKVYEEIDLDKNRDFWADIVVIVEDELAKLRKMEAEGGAGNRGFDRVGSDRRQGINAAVADDIQKVLTGKSATQLAQLQKNIEDKLSRRTDGLDVSYWESLLSQLKAHLARARLRDKHKENLKKKLEMLKAEQKQQLETRSEQQVEEPQPGPSRVIPEADEEEAEASEADHEREAMSEKEADACIAAYLKGNYSPRYVDQHELELGTHVIPEAEDEARRGVERDRVLRGGTLDKTVSDDRMVQEAKKGMGEDEASFAVETALEQSYEWSDKYRPRKPRYFNRVHTGFEWNKYNQTHYDVDNPPPKIVQGYKFNVFYPDLINKGYTPQYSVTPCPDNRDFAVLRVHAGPPYEDIAFKIVNREWEYGYKRGFKCQFHNNIFQLWFHFKRLRYRR